MNIIKNSLVPALSLALVFSVSPVAQAHAEDVSVGVKTETSLHTETTNSDQENKTQSNTHEAVRASSTSKVENEQDIKDGNDSNIDENNQDDGELDVDSHDKAIKGLVHSLTKLANHENDKEMAKSEKDIAEEQDNELSSTTEAIHNVDERGKLLTFLIGADFKSLGSIRSTIAVTDNHITQLEALKAKATSDADKAILDAQIKVLADQKTQMDAYVTAHENVFSLFGWFFKIFQ